MWRRAQRVDGKPCCMRRRKNHEKPSWRPACWEVADPRSYVVTCEPRIGTERGIYPAGTPAPQTRVGKSQCPFANQPSGGLKVRAPIAVPGETVNPYRGQPAMPDAANSLLMGKSGSPSEKSRSVRSFNARR